MITCYDWAPRGGVAVQYSVSMSKTRKRLSKNDGVPKKSHSSTNPGEMPSVIQKHTLYIIDYYKTSIKITSIKRPLYKGHYRNYLSTRTFRRHELYINLVDTSHIHVIAYYGHVMVKVYLVFQSEFT